MSEALGAKPSLSFSMVATSVLKALAKIPLSIVKLDMVKLRKKRLVH